jgi:hypothetical protein
MSEKEFGWIILAIVILGAELIYACSTRYTYIPKTDYVLDRWTGQTHCIGESFDPHAWLRRHAITPTPQSASPSPDSN